MATEIESLITDPTLVPLLTTSRNTLQSTIELLKLLSVQASSVDPSASQSIDALPLETQLLISRHHKTINSHLSILRGQNRNAILGVRRTKEETAKARSEVDRLHLQLQNLYYEQRYLAGEIRACEGYK